MSATLLFVCIHVLFDQWFYEDSQLLLTPLNNIIYNAKTSNLSLHGLHPRYTHVLLNLPVLLGPAGVFAVRWSTSVTFIASVGGVLLLSIFPHQEARFLLPCVPLLVCSMEFHKFRRSFLVSWIFYNLVAGIIYGIYHQGGVIPAQGFLRDNIDDQCNGSAQVNLVYWKTYRPPTWLLASQKSQLQIFELGGSTQRVLEQHLPVKSGSSPCKGWTQTNGGPQM